MEYKFIETLSVKAYSFKIFIFYSYSSNIIHLIIYFRKIWNLSFEMSDKPYVVCWQITHLVDVIWKVVPWTLKITEINLFFQKIRTSFRHIIKRRLKNVYLWKYSLDGCFVHHCGFYLIVLDLAKNWWHCGSSWFFESLISDLICSVILKFL